MARGRIGGGTRLRVVDSVLTGVHQPGESHFELLRAFADDAVLARVAGTLASSGYRSHEFGDSVLIERLPGQPGVIPRSRTRSGSTSVRLAAVPWLM